MIVIHRELAHIPSKIAGSKMDDYSFFRMKIRIIIVRGRWFIKQTLHSFYALRIVKWDEFGLILHFKIRLNAWEF